MNGTCNARACADPPDLASGIPQTTTNADYCTSPNSFSFLHFQQGAVAQLGEHLVCNQGVAGSIPVRSIPLVPSIPSTAQRR